MFRIPKLREAANRLRRWPADVVGTLSLKTRVVLLVAAMIVAGMWALAVGVTLALQRGLTDFLSANLSGHVVGMAANFDRHIELHIGVLSRLAASLTPEILNDPGKLDRALDLFSDSSAVVPDTCLVANGRGIVIGGYPEEAFRRGDSVEDRDYFRQAMASGKPALGSPVRLPAGQPAVPIAVPLRDGAGATAGVLVGSVLLSDPHLFGELEQTRIGKSGWYLMVSPKDRVIVAASNRSRILTTLPGHGVIPLLDRRLEEGYEGPGVTVASIGTEVFSVSRKMATTGWVLIAAEPTAEAFAPVEDLKRRVYLAALAISLGVAGILWFVLARQFKPLARAATAMRRMSAGEMPLAPIPVGRQDEIGELIGSFNRLVAERSRLDESLRAEIADRTRLLRQLEQLSKRLATAQEEERRRIAYALHEELGQELAALRLYLQMLAPGGGAGPESEREDALAVAEYATQRVRELVLNIEPPELRDFGLHAAVRTHCERQAAAGGWTLHIDAPKPEVRLSPAVERACFRVLQEALGNVLLHAKASEVWVHLHQSDNELELGIRDNGIGFDRNAVREENRGEAANLGLFGMQMRARHVGGRVEFKSAIGAGTEVRAVFPVSSDGQAAAGAQVRPEKGLRDDQRLG